MGRKQQISFCCFAWLLFFLSACQGITDHSNVVASVAQSAQKHFQVESHSDFQIISVRTPFVNGKFTEKYVLYPRGTKRPELDSITEYIETPIRSAVLSSTTHVGFFKGLNAFDLISAASNLELVYDAEFQQMVQAGKIKSIGKRTVSSENLIAQNPDVIFAYAIDMAGYEEIKHWRELGQHVILISEFMEKDPIQKANWMYPIALFMEKGDQALKYLNGLENRYDSLKRKAATLRSRPDVFMGYPWKGTWYMSGGKSFQAKLFQDAAANYLWKSSNKESGMPLAVEEVLAKAIEAPFWLNVNAMESKAKIAEDDQRFTSFAAFELNQIYNNNKRVNLKGGNDYWESGVICPDRILWDMIQVLHPEDYPNPNLYYYQQVQ